MSKSDQVIGDFASRAALHIYAVVVRSSVQAKVAERTTGKELVEDGGPKTGAVRVDDGL